MRTLEDDIFLHEAYCLKHTTHGSRAAQRRPEGEQLGLAPREARDGLVLLQPRRSLEAGAAREVGGEVEDAADGGGQDRRPLGHQPDRPTSR